MENEIVWGYVKKKRCKLVSPVTKLAGKAFKGAEVQQSQF